MKAFQLVKYGASSSLVFNEVDLEKPTLSNDDELLVKVHALGLIMRMLWLEKDYISQLLHYRVFWAMRLLVKLLQ